MDKKPEEEKGKKKKKDVVEDVMTEIKMKVRLTFIEELLGTASSNLKIHSTFVSSKGPDAETLAEEVAALGPEVVTEKTKTIFARDADGDPCLWDYQIKGMFKDACGMLSRAKGTKSGTLTAYKKIIDGLIFVNPRQIKIVLPEGKELGDLQRPLRATTGNCERPLRAQTAKGERIALAHSETCPVGSYIEFEITALELTSKIKLEDCIKEWLTYGALRGLGQWRNSGKGRCRWEKLD